MKKCRFAAVLGATTFAGSAIALAQHHPPRSSTSYAGQQNRSIKALSPGEVQGYIQGRGMGLAKAAELNSHPGPMHVLELEAELQLTPQQKIQTQQLKNTMSQAARAGRLLVVQEQKLDKLFASGVANDKNVSATVREIARLQGEIRLVHLRAHVRTKQLLTPQQIKKYDELRGYN